MTNKKAWAVAAGIILLITLLELFVFNRGFLVHHVSGLEQRRLLVEDGVLSQLNYSNGTLFPQGARQRIKFEKLDMPVMAISVTCSHSSPAAIEQVFYRSSNEAFSEQKSFTYQPPRNGRDVYLSLPKIQTVSDLRIHFFDQKGDFIVCNEFVINPYLQFRLTTARLTFYFCIIALAMYELFKATGYRRGSLAISSFFSSIKRNIPPQLHKNKLALLPLAWIVFWLLPWADWLETMPWLKMCISLFIYITPGMVISLLIARDRLSLPGHFSAGVAFSVFFVGALGLTGRIFHWPFEYVKILFAIIGLIGLLALIRYHASGRPLYKLTRFSGRNLTLLLFMVVFGVLANLPSQHSADDLSYLAYLTNWQHAQQLDFREVTYGIGTADSIRFWWSLFPMSLALLAEVSHLHGLLLLGIYLEPFLIIALILAAYTLYEEFLSSQDHAILATLIQFTFLYLLRQAYQPGHMFFERPSDDKVFAAFVLAPVFFVALRHLINFSGFRSGLFFMLSGFSLALTHPIILAYTVFIGGIYATIETLLRKEFAKLAAIAFLLFLILAPSASLRFIDEAQLTRSLLGLESTVLVPDSFSLETVTNTEVRTNVDIVISYIKDTPFYSFNWERVQIAPRRIPDNPLLILLSFSYIGILGVGFIWSLFNLQKDAAAPLIAASSLLVLLCAIPYTGWLVGYFVSARMLYRAPWLFPIGLVAFILLKSAAENRTVSNIQSRIKPASILSAWIPFACLILMAALSEFIYQYQGLHGKQLDSYRDRLYNFAALGQYLEDHIEQPGRFVARPGLMGYLPGLSAKSKVVLFRREDWAPYPVDEDEIASLINNDPSINMDQRIKILDKFNSQYIITEDPNIKDYYLSDNGPFSSRFFEGYWLIKYKE